ncbi:MAG: small multi-drug export protein [Patescibacteria group bacterium]
MIDYGALFQSIPSELAVLLIATLPIAELRAAIPIGIEVYHLSWPLAVSWSIIGNIIPVIILVWFLEPISRWLSLHSRQLDRFFNWLFARTRRKNLSRFNRWGVMALITFVAIPLPITGGWTGAVAAFVFGVPRRQAIYLITIGIFIAAIIVTTATIGISAIF